MEAIKYSPRPLGGILIIARNNLHLTKAAVRTALLQDEACTVLVIDNASTDGTRDWLKSKAPAIATCIYPVQKSLAACWNAGIRAFWSFGCTECLVINNDVELRPDTYCMLRDKQVPFVTAVSVGDRSQLGTPYDRPCPPNGDRPHPDFSCFMIRPEVTDKVGWFEEEYFPAYCEDGDYHIRMHRAGINALCVDLPFYHAAAQTLKQADAGEQARIKRGADSNRWKFRQKYGCWPGSDEYEGLFR